MTTLLMQQVPPQPVPGEMPPPGPDIVPLPVIDPTQDPPPIEDPDVREPTPAPDAPMIARKTEDAPDRPEPAGKGRVEA